MKVPNFVSKLSNQGALIHVLPHIHVEMLGDIEEFFLRFAIKAAEPSGSTEGWILLVIQRDTVPRLRPICSESQVPVLSCSARTALMRL